MPAITLNSKFDIGDIFYRLVQIDSGNRNNGVRIESGVVHEISFEGRYNFDPNLVIYDVWLNKTVEQHNAYHTPEKAAEAALGCNINILYHLRCLKDGGYPQRPGIIAHGGR